MILALTEAVEHEDTPELAEALTTNMVELSTGRN